ncbi:FAD-dependent oxidoreductase [Kocuria palustris]|nr:FAD-dependent oxidoreductase [Kocuria palustris]
MKKAIVIGAGASGLKAAYDLYQNGNFEVTVIEAESRVGGRIKTDHKLSAIGNHYDLGGAWFHDSLNNPVLDLGMELGVISIEKGTAYYDDKDRLYFGSEGQIDVVNNRTNRVAEEMFQFIGGVFQDAPDTPDTSVKQMVEEYFKRYPHRHTEEQRQLARRLARYLELWSGVSWDRMLAKSALLELEGRNIYNVHGYDFLVNHLSKPLEGKIRTGEKVIAIDRSKTPVVVTTEKLTYEADYVVVTLPLGALRQSSEQGGLKWSPALPKALQASIDGVHMGALGKVILEFDEAFWDVNQDQFVILPDDDKAKETGKLAELPPPFTYGTVIVNYAAAGKKLNNNPALVCLTQLPFTEWIESHPDQAWDYFGPEMEKLAVDKAKFTKPTNIIVTNWTQNPHFNGAYAAPHVGEDMVPLIAQLSGEHEGMGLGPTIEFAGEHTIFQATGTIQAAYLSGERAAMHIIDHSGKLN